ncbi:hypothetical protein R9C00_16550 [Flammeovirgaceae bacterium SG7u.111]|nr:hypothetical protein [Flammeovirgaceae bacterium SG7u.132]WPO33313.1 hypothetical protein R9C00_16550 [Flammeovirgaceae bacterium SG7u.111]
MINLQTNIIITELSAWMDGGSVTIKCQNSSGEEFEIEFVQNVIWDWYEGHKIPGRIYFNNELVEQRSGLEEEIIQLLSKAEFKEKEPYDRQLLNEKIDYTNSEKYIEDQSKNKLIKRT